MSLLREDFACVLAHCRCGLPVGLVDIHRVHGTIPGPAHVDAESQTRGGSARVV